MKMVIISIGVSCGTRKCSRVVASSKAFLNLAKNSIAIGEKVSYFIA